MMKYLIIAIVMVLVPVILPAQDTPLSSIYAQYVSEPGFETTEIRPGSTSYDWEKSIDAPEIKDMLNDIESVRIMEYKGEGKYNPGKIWKKISEASTEAAYIEVVNLNGDNEQARLLLLKGNGGMLREIALIAREKDEVTLISVTGNLDMSKAFSPEMMQNLRELGSYFKKDKGECEER